MSNTATQHKPWVRWPDPFDYATLADCSWRFQAPMPYWGRQTGHLLTVNWSFVMPHLVVTTAATMHAVDYWLRASETVQLMMVEKCRVLTGLHQNNTENWHTHIRQSHDDKHSFYFQFLFKKPIPSETLQVPTKIKLDSRYAFSKARPILWSSRLSLTHRHQDQDCDGANWILKTPSLQYHDQKILYLFTF